MRPGRSVVYHLHAHLVVVTKYRWPVFTDTMLSHGEHLMRGGVRRCWRELREFNGGTDRVHLLVHYPPSLVRKYLWGSHF